MRTYVGNAGDTNTFEFAAIKFLYCGFEVRGSFKLDKASDLFLAEHHIRKCH